MVSIILDRKFLNESFIIVKLTLVCLLRIVDGDERPSMGYV